MDKVIKFRAWDNRNKRIISWNELLNSKELLQSFFGNEYYATNPPRYFYERMQFTGLYDCEEKEIYEGDLLSNNYKTDKEVVRQVLFHDGSWIMKRIKGKSKLREELLLGEYHLLNFKVIGNIFEYDFHVIK